MIDKVLKKVEEKNKEKRKNSNQDQHTPKTLNLEKKKIQCLVRIVIQFHQLSI